MLTIKDTYILLISEISSWNSLKLSTAGKRNDEKTSTIMDEFFTCYIHLHKGVKAKHVNIPQNIYIQQLPEHFLEIFMA